MERARARLAVLGLKYQEVNIEQEKEAAQRVESWVGFQSVPTIVVAEEGALVPSQDPAPLAKGGSPRGVDRGSLISEPSDAELDAFLKIHGLLS